MTWRQLRPAARDLACILAWLADAPVPCSLLEDVLAEMRWRGDRDPALAALDGDFLEPTPRGADLRLRQRDLVRSQCRSAKHRQAVVRALLAHARSVPHTGTLEGVAMVRHLVPHLEELAGPLLPFVPEDDLGWPFVALTRYAEAVGAPAEVERWGRLACTRLEERLGPESPHLATALNNLAAHCHLQGRLDEAEALYGQALRIRETVLGPDHPYLVTVLTNLGALARRRRDYPAAERHLQRAREIQSAAAGPDHPTAVPLLFQMADLYADQQCLPLAVSLYRQALTIVEQRLGEHPVAATILNNLGNALGGDEGRVCLERALAIQERLLGPDHPDAHNTRHNLRALT